MQAPQVRAVPVVVSSRDGAGKLVQVRVPLTEGHIPYFTRLASHYASTLVPKCTAAGYVPPTIRELANERKTRLKADSYLLGETGDIAVLVYAVQKGGNDELQLLHAMLLDASGREACSSSIVPGAKQTNDHIEAVDRFLLGLTRLASHIQPHELPVIDDQVLNRVYVEKYLESGSSVHMTGKQLSVTGENTFPLYRVQIPASNGSIHKPANVVFSLDAIALEQTALDGIVVQRTTDLRRFDPQALKRGANGNHSDTSITVMVSYGNGTIAVRTVYEKQDERESSADPDYPGALLSFTAAASETSRETFIARAELKPETWMSIGLPKPGVNPDLPLFLLGENTDGVLHAVLGGIRSRISRIEFLTAVYGDVALLAHVGAADIFKAISHEQ